MNEPITPSQYPSWEYYNQKRESLGQEVLDVDLLTAMASSQDPMAAGDAKKRLIRYWDLLPGRETTEVPTINILDQLAPFSRFERDTLISQLAAIQLTEGCNGSCPFCLFGRKNGVEAKYSFDSVKEFFNLYSSVLPPSLMLYWDSDPFDYRDGDYSFLNIYTAWREIRPIEPQFVSTVIPRGGEDNFVDFMRNAAHEQKGRYRGDPLLSLKVRISLSANNTQRVEATFKKLINCLLTDGYTREEINIFLAACTMVGERFADNDIVPIGPLIDKHDDFRDLDTPACRDGVVISPLSVNGVMVTNPCVYEPSGQKIVPLLPGQIDLTPRLLNLVIYGGLGLEDDMLAYKKTRHQTHLPMIDTHDGYRLQLPDPFENHVLQLGRISASMWRLVGDFSTLSVDQVLRYRSF